MLRTTVILRLVVFLILTTVSDADKTIDSGRPFDDLPGIGAEIVEPLMSFQTPQMPAQFAPIDLSQMGVYTVSNEEAVRRQQLTANISKPQQNPETTTITANFAIPLDRIGAYTVSEADRGNRAVSNNNGSKSELVNGTKSDPFRPIPLEVLGVYTVRGEKSHRMTTESPLMVPPGPIALTNPDGIEDGNETLSALTTGEPALNGVPPGPIALTNPDGIEDGNGTLSVITIGEPALLGTNATIVANQFFEGNDTVSTTISGRFDCRRDGHECHVDDCNLDTGSCNCKGGRLNFDCSISEANLKNETDCNNKTGCLNGGFCFRSNDTFKCACPYGFFGDQCENSQFELRCSEDFLTVIIHPFHSNNSFDGQIYLVEMENATRATDPVCHFSNVTEKGFTKLQASFTDLNDKCGGKIVGNKTHQITALVQSNHDWLTPFDQVITLSCSINVTKKLQETVMVEVSGKETPVTISNNLTNLPSQSLAVRRNVTDIIRVAGMATLTLKKEEVDGNGSIALYDINGAIKVGQVMVFTITNTNTTYYQTMRVEDCQLLMIEEQTSLPLIENQCPASRFAWTVVQWTKTVRTNESASFYLRVPGRVLPGEPRRLTLTCSVKLCNGNKAEECETKPNGCSTTFMPPSYQMANYGRKKRQAEDGFEHFDNFDVGNERSVLVVLDKEFDIEYDDSDDESGVSTITSSFGIVFFATIFILYL